VLAGEMVGNELPARNKGISGTQPTTVDAGAACIHGVGKARVSYHLVTPAKSIGPLMGSLSS
jgi:hypothetical protein